MLYESTGIKKYLGWYTAPLLLGAILAFFMLAYWYGTQAWTLGKNTASPRQISVSGEGKMSVRPDIAKFSASVVTTAPRIGDAQRENAKSGNAVIEFLKKQGVEEKDIKTVSYSINPQYQYFDVPPCYRSPCPPHKPPEIISYEVRNMLEVTVRDLNKVDDLLEGVVENGSNEVGSVVFTVDNPEKILAEARKKAIDDAKEKAKLLAQDLGIRLGHMVSFSESSGGIPIPYYEEKLGVGGGGAPMPAPSIQPGEQELKINVTLYYEFR